MAIEMKGLEEKIKAEIDQKFEEYMRNPGASSVFTLTAAKYDGDSERLLDFAKIMFTAGMHAGIQTISTEVMAAMTRRTVQ